MKSYVKSFCVNTESYCEAATFLWVIGELRSGGLKQYQFGLISSYITALERKHYS